MQTIATKQKCQSWTVFKHRTRSPQAVSLGWHFFGGRGFSRGIFVWRTSERLCIRD